MRDACGCEEGFVFFSRREGLFFESETASNDGALYEFAGVFESGVTALEEAKFGFGGCCESEQFAAIEGSRWDAVAPCARRGSD